MTLMNLLLFFYYSEKRTINNHWLQEHIKIISAFDTSRMEREVFQLAMTKTLIGDELIRHIRFRARRGNY